MHHLPMLGDGVEAWLQQKMDEYEKFGRGDGYHSAISDLLDDYRAHAKDGRVMLAPE